MWRRYETNHCSQNFYIYKLCFGGCFFKQCYAIYAEYSTTKTSERIGTNYLKAYSMMEQLSLNTLTLQVNVLSYGTSLNDNFFNNAQNLIKALVKNAEEYKAFVSSKENQNWYVETNKYIDKHYLLVQNFTNTILNNLDFLRNSIECTTSMNSALDNVAMQVAQSFKKAEALGINGDITNRYTNLNSLSTLIKTSSYMAIRTRQEKMLKNIPNKFPQAAPVVVSLTADLANINNRELIDKLSQIKII